MVSAAKILPKTLCHLPAFGRHLLCVGICRQPYAGVEMGDALVGLQRVFSESERPDLSAGGSMLWSGRYAAQLLSAPVLHAGVPPDQAPMADGSLRRSAGSLYFGYNLLCGMASHRPGHCVVNVPACAFMQKSTMTVILIGKP